MAATTDPVWYTNGPQTNPGSNTVLATTGAWPATTVASVHVVFSCDAAATINVQQIAIDGVTVLNTQAIYLAPNAFGQHLFTFTLVYLQSVQAILPAGVTGHVSASILAGRKTAMFGGGA